MHVLRFHPGETLVLNFVLPFSPYDVQAVALSFRNGNGVAFETVATSCVPEPAGTNIKVATKCRVGYTITQAESLQFNEYDYYKAQLNVYGPNGSRIASDEIRVETGAQQLIDPSYMSISVPQVSQGGTITDATKQISYNDLINKPSINDVILYGNRNLPEDRITNDIIDEIMGTSNETPSSDNTNEEPSTVTETPEEPTTPVDPEESQEESGGE